MSEAKKKKKAEAFANHVVMMFLVISKEAIAPFYFKINLDDIEALVVAWFDRMENSSRSKRQRRDILDSFPRGKCRSTTTADKKVITKKLRILLP